MESFSCKWLLLSFLLTFWANSDSALSAVDGVKGGTVRGVNLGNWLVVERWMKPELFNNIPEGDMLDGAQVRFRSLKLNKYISAKNGGGSGVFVDQEKAVDWETFRLWRVTQSKYQFRAFTKQFLSCTGQGASVTATSISHSDPETFTIERESNNRVRIKHFSGKYLQASSGNELKADYPGIPGWDDDGSAAIFEMTFDRGGRTGDLQGEYQLSNGLGPEKAKEVLTAHRNSYVTREDFQFLSEHTINTVRIPVGWWITEDPNPPAPYVAGSLEALDNAFTWAQESDIKCIIDLHAAPGSQNGESHSSTPDGSIEWTKPDNIQRSLEAIKFLASRYGNHDALLGIELLNEPHAPDVSADILKKYYHDGYDIVREHSEKAYVIMCQRLGEGSNPKGLYDDIASMGLPNVVVDLHYYNLYDGKFNNMSPQQNIEYIYNDRKPDIKYISSTANGPLLFIGEWVNEWYVKDGKMEDYQRFGQAQLDVYGSTSFGWAYWSFKNVHEHWDLGSNINNTFLLLH